MKATVSTKEKDLLCKESNYKIWTVAALHIKYVVHQSNLCIDMKKNAKQHERQTTVLLHLCIEINQVKIRALLFLKRNWPFSIYAI